MGMQVPSVSKVVPLNPGQVVTGEPNHDIVEMLERYLEEARKGEIVGLAIAFARPNDVTATAFWYGEAGHKLTAAVAMLNHDIMGHASGRWRDVGGNDAG